MSSVDHQKQFPVSFLYSPVFPTWIFSWFSLDNHLLFNNWFIFITRLKAKNLLLRPQDTSLSFVRTHSISIPRPQDTSLSFVRSLLRTVIQAMITCFAIARGAQINLCHPIFSWFGLISFQTAATEYLFPGNFQISVPLLHCRNFWPSGLSCRSFFHPSYCFEIHLPAKYFYLLGYIPVSCYPHCEPDLEGLESSNVSITMRQEL